MGNILEEKYEILGLAGSGGSGNVYKACDLHLHSIVAVKKVSKDKISEIEIGVMKKLRHSALPVITDYFEDINSGYLVMEYIEGITLKEYIELKGCVQQKKAIEWGIEIAEVLCYMHTQNEPILYRDLKPANIMLDQNQNIRLIDFGTAFFKYEGRMTGSQNAGTYGYSAPEQFMNTKTELLDERCDVYGLGATLHHMLTGNNPSLPPYMLFPIRNYDKTLSVKLEKIIKKAVEKERGKRFGTIKEMADALKWCSINEKRRRLYCRTGKVCYYIMIAGMEFAFLNSCRFAQIQGTEKYGMEVLGTGCVVLLLCMVRTVATRMVSGSGNMRVEKSVFLSGKIGKGLLLFMCSLLAALFCTMPKAKAATEVLKLNVRNQLGQKLLIRYDAVYCPTEDIRLELPLKELESGEDYILKIECSNIRTKLSKSRSYFLKGPKP